MDFKCIGCGAKVDENASVCPACGRSKPTAIRVLGIPIGPGVFLLFLVALALFFLN